MTTSFQDFTTINEMRIFSSNCKLDRIPPDKFYKILQKIQKQLVIEKNYAPDLIPGLNIAIPLVTLPITSQIERES